MEQPIIDYMQELEELINKFWAHQTTKAENERLLQLLEQYQAIAADSVPEEPFQKTPEPNLPPDRAASILQKMHSRLGMLEERQQVKIAVVRKLYRRLAVAAAVLVLAVSAFLWTSNRGHQAVQAIATRPAIVNPLVNITNDKDSAMTLVLEDGSTVQLEKNSSLSYYKPFINDRRDISLKGIALFKVAKDRKRPFTVYAGGIATTALGTQFLVNATDGRKVVVRLLDGKVAIKTAAGSNMTMNDVYLTPGQEFSFDRSSRQYVVNTVHDRPANIATPPASVIRSELVFQKESLGKVFQKVGRLYNVHLNFRNEDVRGLYFTGTFLKTDKLDVVLSTICNVNDLQLASNGDTITITRSH